jgi:hypothetical protein
MYQVSSETQYFASCRCTSKAREVQARAGGTDDTLATTKRPGLMVTISTGGVHAAR